mgnify:CR=1 FL=1|jgi:uncharacterized RDD family membrane protein YckC
MDRMPDAAIVLAVESTPGPPAGRTPDHRVRATSGRLRQTSAGIVDHLIVMLPGLALVNFVATATAQRPPAFVGPVTAETGWSRVVRLFSSDGVVGLSDAEAREWLAFALPLIAALLAIPLFQFLYLGITLTWRGRTVGMLVAGIRVDAPATPGRIRFRRAVTRAALQTLIETGLVALALVAMLVGPFPIGLVLWGAAVVLFWHNVLPMLGPSRRTLVDRLVGTTVVRTPTRASTAPARATGASPPGASRWAASGRAVPEAAQTQAMAVAGPGRARYLSRRAPGRLPSIGRNTRHLWR